ncbi:hypothetical protein [Aurantiacibacter poecillastricola]|uniref:hypothetical protein n=1 Tax=Aurantiacibacter poecillastricola TaxID=3064385 RepID=UPI00273D7542|nr:hypothetical protein [Aurantiacibacter sp. 219JJ12-13]MDP5260823.1 hypothetical protein [Aurantiacibacter sp. 219JJ12-13]
MTCAKPKTRRRIPAFHPVPVTPRRDGWTPERQAAFIGYLAQTRCVTTAAGMVGKDKTSAYRLRKRAGAEGFAAAWDVALGRGKQNVTLASAKSTGLSAGYRFRTGLAQVVMYRGKYRATNWKTDDNALLQLVAQLSRAERIDG